jgi:hypothetical protein
MCTKATPVSEPRQRREQWAGYVQDHLSNESVLLASGARRVDTAAKEVHVPRLTDSGTVDWNDELDTIGPDPAIRRTLYQFA